MQKINTCINNAYFLSETGNEFMIISHLESPSHEHGNDAIQEMMEIRLRKLASSSISNWNAKEEMLTKLQ